MNTSKENLVNILSNPEKVLELAEAHYQHRNGIDPLLVRRLTQRTLKRINDLLEKGYWLTYLEAKLHCDEYLREKKSLVDQGENYGYLHSRVEMNKGTIDAYFQERRPSDSGYVRANRIPRGKAGYSVVKLQKYASGACEMEMALVLEGHFHRLRKQADLIKNARSVIRGIEIFMDKTQFRNSTICIAGSK